MFLRTSVRLFPTLAQYSKRNSHCKTFLLFSFRDPAFYLFISSFFSLISKYIIMLGWGVNSYGQLGLGASLISSLIPKPKLIPFFNKNTCIQVSSSLIHSLFLLNDGSVYSSGNNDYSQLGREGRTSIPGKIELNNLMSTGFHVERVILPENEDGAQVACGQHFSACLTVSGKIAIWGSLSGKTTNDDGLFFNKPEYVIHSCYFHYSHSKILFVQTRVLKGFTDKRMIQVAAGYTHCLGLTDVSSNVCSFLARKFVHSFQDGTVYGIGLNAFGQLGLGHCKTRKEATPIACLRGSPIIFIACGAHHSLIISKSGYVASSKSISRFERFLIFSSELFSPVV